LKVFFLSYLTFRIEINNVVAIVDEKSSFLERQRQRIEVKKKLLLYSCSTLLLEAFVSQDFSINKKLRLNMIIG